MASKWAGFASKDYGIVDLGRPAVFLLPSWKLQKKIGDETVEDNLHRFLLAEFGAFTTTVVPYFGVWRNGGSRPVHDESRLYEVSFAGKKKIPILLKKLAEIACLIDEDCVYFKAGQYTCLLYPRRNK